MSTPAESASASIDAKIIELGDWRGKTLAKVREIVHEADPEIVEEWKWVKAFNSSLDGNVRRAIDIREGDKIHEAALKALIREAVALNINGKSKSRPRTRRAE